MIDKFCTYKSTHPNGYYYYGKSTTSKIAKGYRGSGNRILSCFKKYPRTEWAVEILQTFETESDAYKAEALLVTSETLAEAFCLNLKLGGEGGQIGWAKGDKKPRTPEHQAALNKALKGRKMPKPTKETCQNISKALKGKPTIRTPESIENQKRTIMERGWKRTPLALSKLQTSRQLPGALKRGMVSLWPRPI